MRPLSKPGKQLLQYLLPDAFLWRLPRSPECALTFDDGPHPEYTPRVLDLLADHAIQATFFLVGEAVALAPKLVCRIVSEGHAVGSHTYSHREIPSLTADEMWHELSSCRTLIHDVAGVDTRLLRPPRGRISVLALARVRRWGYRLVHWSKTYSDYLQDGRESLLRRMRSNGLAAGDIALLHDNNCTTLEALAAILPEWRERGWRFVRLM